jgi:ketosteroid isomerase-like protein
MADDAQAVVMRFLDAGARRDVDALVATFDEDAVVDWTASRSVDAGTYRGRDAIREFVGAYFETFDEIEIVTEEVLQRGETIVVATRWHFGRADGIRTSTRSAFLATVRAGQIVHLRMEQSLAEALEALGEAPA